ncbi:MAG TPA: PQQ-binding-like beta-propeller repeat protein, partial [Deinococcales bacterium]|nr:PQQ-binding-like beta-propeller repeat protein [Deinococcales bacterium]
PAWSFQASAPFSSPAALASDVIYAGSEDGQLHALGLNGLESWSLALDGPVTAAPVIGPDGHLYLGAGNHFYALATTSLPGKGPWPSERQDAAGLGRAP